MRETTRLVGTIIATTAVVGLLGSCGTSVERRIPDGAPVNAAAAERPAVPRIQLITKPQSEDPTRYEMSRLVVASWQSAGIDAELLPVGSAQLNSRTVASKDYDVYMISYDVSPERLDPDNLLARFTSASATETGPNISMYADPEYDRAYADQLGADAEARPEAVRRAQRILREDLPAVPLVHPRIGYAYRSDQWTGLDVTSATPVYSLWNAVRATPLDGTAGSSGTGSGGTELVVGTTTDPATLNPALATQIQSLTPMQLIYDTVLTVDPSGELVPNAAREWSQEGDQVRLSLDPAARFSDGRPVTGEDLAFTIDYLTSQGAALFAPSLAGVENVEVDGTEVTITLAQASASFPTAALTKLPILPRHIWEGLADPREATTADLIGSGPFTLRAFRSGQQIEFDRNPAFRDPPQVESLRVIVLGSFDAAAGALQSDQIDIISPSESVASQYRQIEGSPGVEVVYGESYGWRGLHYNVTRGPLRDLSFRRALTALLPIDDLVEVANQGEADPAGSVIAPYLQNWHDPQIAPFGYDPAAAMRALTDGGYSYDDAGVLRVPAHSIEAGAARDDD